MKRIIYLFIALICFHIAEGQNPPITPAWAFRHIVWEDSLNTSAGARQILDGYLQRDIPVGGIIIDSPWSTAYCDFNWDTGRYPDYREMGSYFKEKNVKVILWMTGAVNCTSVDAPLQKHEAFDEIVARQYGINGSKPGNWWKGDGVFLDFTNPDAVKWWYMQLDKVFGDAVWGWKVDNGESWLGTPMTTSKGVLGNSEFKPYYYDAMYDYTVSRNPDAIILARPYSHQTGYHSSVDKMSLGWCGDFDGDWKGMKLQIQNIYLSAKRGYGAVGCEVAGFWGPRSNKKQFVRYAQFGCMTASMINGGSNGSFTNHLPWWHDKETEDIYRYCVVLHDELIPYMFSTVVDAHFRGGSLIKDASFEEESHLLGDYLFTKVITSENDEVSFHLPSEGEWIDLYTGEKYEGGTFIKKAYPLNQFPLFIKSGAVIPMDISGSLTGIGDESMKGRRTILLYPDGVTHKVLHLPCGDGVDYTDCEVRYDKEKGHLKIRGESDGSYTVLLRHVPEVRAIKNVSSWEYDKQKRELRIDCQGAEIDIDIAYKNRR